MDGFSSERENRSSIKYVLPKRSSLSLLVGKNNPLFTDGKVIKIYEDQNLSKKFLEINGKGIFNTKGEQLSYFYCASNVCAATQDRLVFETLKTYPHLAEMVIVTRGKNDGSWSDGFNIVIPFDEREGDLVKIFFGKKTLYLKFDQAIGFKVHKNDVEKNQKTYAEYKDEINHYLKLLIDCFKDKNRDKNKNCPPRIVDPNEFDEGQDLLKLQVEVRYAENFDNLIKYFNMSDKLIGYHGNDYIYLCTDTTVNGSAINPIDDSNYEILNQIFFPRLARGMCLYIDEKAGATKSRIKLVAPSTAPND